MLSSCTFILKFGYCPSVEYCSSSHPTRCVQENACEDYDCALTHTEPRCVSWETCEICYCPRRHGPSRPTHNVGYLQSSSISADDLHFDSIDSTDAESDAGISAAERLESQMSCSPNWKTSIPRGVKRSRQGIEGFSLRKSIGKKVRENQGEQIQALEQAVFLGESS